MQKPSIYDGILSPSADFDDVRSGLLGALSYIDIQASPDSSTKVYYSDNNPDYGVPWYAATNVSQNNGASFAPNNTFDISGEWIYIDGVSDANLLITLNDRDGPNPTAADAPIRIGPGFFIRKTFTSMTVVGIASDFGRARVIYGGGDSAFESSMRPNFGDPMPTYNALKYRNSLYIRTTENRTQGGAVGTTASQVLGLFNSTSKSRHDFSSAIVTTPLANCVVEYILASASNPPVVLDYPAANTGNGVVQAGQTLLASEFFAAQGTYKVNLRDHQFYGTPTDACRIYVRFRCAAAAVSTAQPRSDLILSRAE